jgi:transposase InsO family protein
MKNQRQVNTFSRFSPAVVPRFGFRAPDVIDVLERVCSEVGYPASIRVDQGSEFISRDLDLWAYTRNVTLELAAPPFGSAGRASRPTMRSLNRSTASSGRSA